MFPLANEARAASPRACGLRCEPALTVESATEVLVLSARRAFCGTCLLLCRA